MVAADAEVESIRTSVARHFSVYGVVVTPMALTFQVTVTAESLETAFDGLRRELVPRNYIPTITQERGETVVHVQRRPTTRFRGREVNAVLLVVTIFTTLFFGGAWNWSGYSGAPFFSLESIALGAVFFGIPLLTILGAHEMGHYLVARHYKVHASMPFFLPSIPPLGTFGAFISMRDPIPSRRALLDIGVSGPLVGFLIAIPVTLAGLGLSAATPVEPTTPEAGAVQVIQASVLFDFLSLFFPLPESYVLHPLAFAGWVGLFVTAINLLPAGQLDGGHIARALLGNRQHYLSWLAVLALFAMGTLYIGWILFGFLILMIGVRHPPPLNDITRLDASRKLIGIGAVTILVLTFVPQPFALIPISQGMTFESLDRQPLENLQTTVSLNASVTATFVVNNTGGAREQVGLRIDPRNLDNFGWTLRFLDVTVEGDNASWMTVIDGDNTTFTLNGSERAIVRLFIQAPASLDPVPPSVAFHVRGQIIDTSIREELEVVVTLA